MPITWLTKIDGFDLGDPQKNVNAADMNEIKSVVNTNETNLTDLGTSFTTFTGSYQANFVENEVPSGSVNGVNVTFILANTPLSGSVKVYHNGIRLKATVGYTISGVTITFAVAPETGDIILADYRK